MLEASFRLPTRTEKYLHGADFLDALLMEFQEMTYFLSRIPPQPDHP